MILKYRVKPSFMHTKNASENNIALQKKFFSTFKMACLDFYVGHLSGKSSCYFYEKKRIHIFV